MNKIDSNKVLSHIDEAKNWLDEAKEEYTQSNRVRGELNLNLAQAEVKYAWELSRRQNVTQCVQMNQSRRGGKYFLPVAAACLIILGFTGGLYWVMRNGKAEAPALMVKNKNIPIPVASVRPQQEISVAEATIKPVVDHSGDNLAANPNRNEPKKLVKVGDPPTKGVKSDRKIVKTEVVKKTSTTESVANQSQNIAATAVNQDRKVAVTADGSSERIDVAERIAKAVTPENKTDMKVIPSESESGLLPNVTKLTVASFIIDEEALTKEASYSLKNGK